MAHLGCHWLLMSLFIFRDAVTFQLSLKVFSKIFVMDINSFQTDSGAHPASYPMGTEVKFPGGKAVRA
jgi:hypothetical protein